MTELIAKYNKHVLKFSKTRRTSKKALNEKFSYILSIWDNSNEDKIGIGECSFIPGISPEVKEDYEKMLDEVCNAPTRYIKNNYLLNKFPSILFGLLMAWKDLQNKGDQTLFESEFTKKQKPILINGLVWIGSFDEMKTQIDEKIDQHFNCIKIKIGAIDFNKELELLHYLRKKSRTVTIRLDANGAFSPDDVTEKLKALSKFNIHSIEQPIAPKQFKTLQILSEKSPIPIALDEELVGYFDKESKEELILKTKPKYLVLKPSLLGGFNQTDEWIQLAKKHTIGWWATSYLESNIGLFAIAQYLSKYNNTLHQGLGTGKLFTNNLKSPIKLVGEKLFYVEDEIS